MFDEELSQTVWIVHTLLQLCQEITVWHKAEVRQEKSNTLRDEKQTAQRGRNTRWTTTNTISSWSVQEQNWELTLYASRRSGGCFQTQSCPSLACPLERPDWPSRSCSPLQTKTHHQSATERLNVNVVCIL